MADSPKYEESGYGPPMEELDDHRFQPESLRRTDTMVSMERTRRDTRNSSSAPDQHHLSMLSVRDAYNQISNTRDFEYAIEDDEHNISAARTATKSNRQTDAASPSPMGPTGRDLHRPPRIIEEEGSDGRPASMKSARSISPPHSVEAFAGRRRGRAGTATSIAHSFITHHSPNIAAKERRPTFGSAQGPKHVDSEDSSQGSVEDDVCFPVNEDVQSRPYNIDFDELEDFVVQYKHNPTTTTITVPFSSKSSFHGGNSDQRERVFTSLCKGKIDDGKDGRGSKAGRAAKQSDSDESFVNEKLQSTRTGIEEMPPNETINRWSFFSSELEEIIHAPDLGDLLMPGESFEQLFRLSPDGGVWWLDMLMPTEEEVEAICKAFGIHGLTREDIIQQETREKVELFKSYYFVCFRSFFQMDKTSDCYLEPVNVYAVVFREGILTFTFCPSPHAANVRRRMGKLLDYVSLGADWICYALIDDIVDSYGPVIREVENETEAIEDNVFTAREEDSRAILHQIGDCRKLVMSLTRLLGGKADVIKGFAKRCNEQYSIAPRQDVGLYLSDIQDHVITMMSNLSHFEKMLGRSHANYLAQISLESIAQGNRSNYVLGRITFAATILVPVNLIFGAFSMNVPIPGKDSTGLGWFGGILGLTVTMVVLAIILAKRFHIW